MAGLPADILSECKTLGRAIQATCPELSRHPLYILNAPQNYPHRETIHAACVSGTDFRAREALIESGEYVAPGRVILFFDGKLSLEYALGLTVHEICHAIEMPVAEIDIEPTPETFKWQTLSIAEAMGGPIQEATTFPRWFPSHGVDFIRACLHVCHRACALGYEIGWPHACFAGERYQLSDAWQYASALGDEPERLAGKSFAEILSSPPPDEFIEFFRSDAAFHSQSISQR